MHHSGMRVHYSNTLTWKVIIIIIILNLFKCQCTLHCCTYYVVNTKLREQMMQFKIRKLLRILIGGRQAIWPFAKRGGADGTPEDKSA